MVKIFIKPPRGFKTGLQVAACYLKMDGKLLLLERSPLESQPFTWGVPAGKIETDEKIEEAMLRELFEETGIQLSSRLLYIKPLYISDNGKELVYHMFETVIKENPLIRLSEEHINYKWASLSEAKKMPLMPGAREALHHYTEMNSKLGFGQCES